MLKGLVSTVQYRPPPRGGGGCGCLTWLLKNSIIFGTGLYTGVYIAQNYQIDKVEDPKTLFEKAQTYIRAKMEEFSKKGKD